MQHGSNDEMDVDPDSNDLCFDVARLINPTCSFIVLWRLAIDPIVDSRSCMEQIRSAFRVLEPT